MRDAAPPPLAVTGIASSARLAEPERALLGVAAHASEYGVRLRVLTPGEGALLARLRNAGVEADAVPAPGGALRGPRRPPLLPAVPLALVGLVRWSRRLGAHPWIGESEVLYSVGSTAHLAVALLRRHPHVWHLDQYPPRGTGAVWKLLARNEPEAVIAASNAVRAAWEPGSSASVALGGVDLGRFAPRAPTGWIHRSLGLPPARRLIGVPATLSRREGHIEVVDAFERIRGEIPDVDLVLGRGPAGGAAPEAAYAEALGKRVARADRVHLLDLGPDVELAYPEFAFTVHRSTRPEPFGRVVLESMACAIPAVAAAEGGPAEILGAIRPGRSACGWLVAPNEVQALAAALRDALRLAPDALRGMGEAGRRRAAQAFAAPAHAGIVCDVFHRVGR